MALFQLLQALINYRGRIADIYGRKPIMIFSMASNAVFMLGFYL